MIHTYVAMVMAAEVDEVDGGTHPQVEAWQPHQNSVLEALGEIWVLSVPCAVPILVERRRKKRIRTKQPTSDQTLTIQKRVQRGAHQLLKSLLKGRRAIRNLSLFLNVCDDVLPDIKGLNILSDCKENQKFVTTRLGILSEQEANSQFFQTSQI